jgi:hypothetical protein
VARGLQVGAGDLLPDRVMAPPHLLSVSARLIPPPVKAAGVSTRRAGNIELEMSS